MNKSPLVALAATLLLSTAPAVAPVVAATRIQRCQSSDGTLIYTDKACVAFDAKAVPMSGELLTRIAHEQALSERAGIDAGTPLQSDVSPTTAVATRRRSASGGCARTPTQLAMDLRAALALGDVNHVAESYHWVGMSSKQGERTLDRLQHLTGKPVLDSHYYNAQIGFGNAADADGSWTTTADVRAGAGAGGNVGVLQLVQGDGALRSAIDFTVQRYAGCYFVEF